jgi:hypothetical protein
MSRAGNIELYHGRTEVDMALSGKAGTAKVRSSAGKKSAQAIIECGFPASAPPAGVLPWFVSVESEAPRQKGARGLGLTWSGCNRHRYCPPRENLRVVAAALQRSRLADEADQDRFHAQLGYHRGSYRV